MIVTVLWILAAIAFVSFQVCGVWSAAVVSGLSARVNRALPVERRFEWYQQRSPRLWSEMRNRHPHELRRAWLVAAVGAGCFLVAIGSASGAAWLQHHP